MTNMGDPPKNEAAQSPFLQALVQTYLSGDTPENTVAKDQAPAGTVPWANARRLPSGP